MQIFDGHNDTLTRTNVRAFLQGSDSGQIDLPRAETGGLSGGLFAIFTPPPPESPERDPMYGITFSDDGYRVAERSPIAQGYAETFTNGVIDLAEQIEAASNGRALIVRNTGDIRHCFGHSVFAMVLHLEGAEAIQPDLSNLQSYYNKGVRSVGLTWSRPNAFGHGVPFAFPQSPDTGAGLTETGKALVRACNQLGIVVDLAHLNERGFFDVAAISDAPLVVSHADVYAICPSSRNLTDAQIEAVGASGGIIGINFEAMNTHPQSSIEQDVPLTQITRHLDYVVDKIGVDCVGFGSDFDGADMPHDLHDVTGLPKLIECLRASGYDQ
ncbi:MAG: peptidase, partial [Chloroflexi bacterium]|nr:peptidase [Chloroflexota bacterium]